ncbi:MAG: Vacuolar protein sorting-associated protein 41 [Chaenotheca gracillima]|nr:MAG: Vacuolar protein sorting-associated protein 41 [Chaenotheca gracillima]
MADVRTVRRRVTRYRWPAFQLNFWILIFLAASATTLGIFSYFITVQGQLSLNVPWYMPYWSTVGGLGVAFIILLIYLQNQSILIPGVVILGSFILFVLWLTGLIKTAIVLFGPQGSVNDLCSRYVTNQPSHGQNEATLAWLQQQNSCNCWKAAFAFELIGTVFLLWLMIMAYQVYQDEFRD